MDYRIILKELEQDKEFKKYSSNWLEEKIKAKEIYIWGAGQDGKNAASLIKESSIFVVAFIDMNSQKHIGQEIECINPKDMDLSKVKGLLLSSKDYEQEMEERFLSMLTVDSIRDIYVYSWCDLRNQLVRDWLYAHGKINLSSLLHIGCNSDLFYFGDYKSWIEAEMDAKNHIKSSGYDNTSIFEQVVKAYELCHKGEAVFERDGVAFYKPYYSHDFLAAIFEAQAELGEKLCVLDFGGSLGSTYFQHKKILKKLGADWNIIEQPHFVKYGRERIEDISFFIMLKIASEKKK
ncbi:hypothetical protein UYO_2983 [Lachnospiraceae bacterium JC7]|nr:hypothetical protein UYO_2983 [Lachnospiraceae bacterium JC7]